MKKHDFLDVINLFLTPAVLIVLGLILVVNPDSASALIARIFGWLLLAAGVGFAVAALVDRIGTVAKVISALLCLAVGSFLLRNPLVLAAGIGRLAGILLTLRGIQDMIAAGRWHKGMLTAVITTIVGVILLVLPMTTSRLVLLVCGVVMLVSGVGMLAARLKFRRYLRQAREPDDPNIIDAL